LPQAACPTFTTVHDPRVTLVASSECSR
jgi:hypothetical protein